MFARVGVVGPTRATGKKGDSLDGTTRQANYSLVEALALAKAIVLRNALGIADHFPGMTRVLVGGNRQHETVRWNDSAQLRRCEMGEVSQELRKSAWEIGKVSPELGEHHERQSVKR